MATAIPLLIVSHGQPSAPAGPEAEMARLSEAVASHLQDRPVRSATLAGRGTLARALEELGPGPVEVYPFFMSDGWFVSTHLPRRLQDATNVPVRLLPPFGMDAAMPELCAKVTREGARAAGLEAGKITLLLAAHGSPRDPRPASVTRRIAGSLRDVFRNVVCGYVDEAPFLADAARIEGPALCLPFFAAANGHVQVDLPEALAEAQFEGPVLPPVGTAPEVPALIADAVKAG
jgi:sirohydrochlorin ferrochelatase